MRSDRPSSSRPGSAPRSGSRSDSSRPSSRSNARSESTRSSSTRTESARSESRTGSKPYQDRADASARPQRANQQQGGYNSQRPRTQQRAPRPQSIRPELQHLWSQWQDVSPKPALDKWLRQVKSTKDNLDAVLARNEAMFHALRFQQLACVLETMLNNEKLDLTEFDNSWTERATTNMHPFAFWHWIELRSQRDWGFARDLRQSEHRLALFRRVEAQVKEQPTSLLALLWNGLRPQWAALLEQRAKVSGWSKDQYAQFLRMQNHQPPLWLRINELQGPVTAEQTKAVHGSLVEQGVTAQLRGDHICAMGGNGIYQTDLYKNGRIEIQDLASQHIAAALDVKPGEKIWDACAGAGGKSLALAARLNNKGALVATDLHAYKLEELKRRASRAGARNIRTFVWNGQEALRLPQEIARQGGFDKILVDAPCSASGTWRRNPDARWRFSDDDRADLNKLQLQLLTQASQALRSGGLIAYATCSWAVDENEDLVAAFIKASGFELVEQRMLGAPQEDSDCMFVAVLKKQ